MKIISKYIIISISLGILFSLLGEGLFYLFYFNDLTLDKTVWLFYILVLLYSIPIFLLYRGNKWYLSLLIILVYPFFSLGLAIIFGKAYPIQEKDFAGGFLGLFTIVGNFITVLFGLAIGHISRFLIYQLHRYRQK